MVPKEMYDESMGRCLAGRTVGTVQVTSHPVAFGHFDKRGHRGGAWLKDLEAAGVEDAARWGIEWAWHLALEHYDRALGLYVWVGYGHC
jgi:hypothetical protein